MVETDPSAPGALPPPLRVLLQHWETGAAEAPCGLPHPGVVLPHIRDVWLNHLAILEPAPRAGYVVTSCGFALIRRFGRLATGHRVSALASGIRQELALRLLRARQSRRPVVGQATLPYGRALLRIAEIVLPLSDDGVSVGRLALFAVELHWTWSRASDPPARSRAEAALACERD